MISEKEAKMNLEQIKTERIDKNGNESNKESFNNTSNTNGYSKASELLEPLAGIENKHADSLRLGVSFEQALKDVEVRIRGKNRLVVRNKVQEKLAQEKYAGVELEVEELEEELMVDLEDTIKEELAAHKKDLEDIFKNEAGDDEPYYYTDWTGEPQED